MIQKSALIDLTQAQADLAFSQAKSLPGAVVDMIEQSDGLFTVTVIWDDGGATIDAEEATAFDKTEFLAKAVARPRAAAVPRTAGTTVAAPAFRLGDLSKRFESNGNPGAIGHDSTGGPSYGEYQIATRTGTMKAFFTFLRTDSPPFFAALEQAGGAAAAAIETAAFRDAWRAAARDAEFAASQHRFIQFTHYTPFARRLDNDLGLGSAERSGALQNVIWSVAVQHGPNNRVFHNALAGRTVPALADKQAINAVYDERSKLDKYFSSSKPQVLAGLAARFVAERKLALQMLG